MEKAKAKITQILRWTERYTKTDMVYLGKGSFWMLVGHAIQAVSGLALAIAFAHLVDKQTYGVYQFVLSISGIISALTLTGMGTAVTRSIIGGNEGALRAGFRAQIMWAPIVIFAGAVLASYYYLNGNIALALSFLVAGSLSPFISGFNLGKSYFIGKQLFKESTLFGFSRKLIPVAAMLTTLFLTQNVVILIIVYFASNTLSAGLLYWRIISHFKLPITSDPEMVRYGKHLSFLGIFSEVATQADKVLMFHFLGAAPVAIYTLAQLPINHMRNISKLVLSVIYPKLGKTSFADLKKILPQKFRIFFLITLIATITYIILAPFLFKLLFPTYIESVIISQVLALMMLMSARALYGQALTVHRKERELYILNISQSVLKIFLLVILLPLFGIWGAVYALLATQLYDMIASRYFFLRASD